MEACSECRCRFLPNGVERDWGFEDREYVNAVGELGTEGDFEEPTERELQIELPPELLFPIIPSSPTADPMPRL